MSFYLAQFGRMNADNALARGSGFIMGHSPEQVLEIEHNFTTDNLIINVRENGL